MINEHNSPQIHHRVSAETSPNCLDLYKMSTKGEREIERERLSLFSPRGKDEYMKETNIKQVDLLNATTQLSCGTV